MAYDIVNQCVVDLTARIEEVPAVAQKVITMYTQDELLSTKKKLGFPAVGVVYVGMRGKDDSSRTGLAAEIVFDIYLIGGDQCSTKLLGDDTLPTTTTLLDDIRDAIKCEVAPGQRKWKFVFELPADITDSVLAYVQRWSTTVVLTNQKNPSA